MRMKNKETEIAYEKLATTLNKRICGKKVPDRYSNMELIAAMADAKKGGRITQYESDLLTKLMSKQMFKQRLTKGEKKVMSLLTYLAFSKVSQV